MELKIRVEEFKNELLKKIEESAKKGDIASVISNTKMVEETEKLLKNMNEIEKYFENLKQTSENKKIIANLDEKDISTINYENIPPLKSNIYSNSSHGILTSRERGEIRKREFLNYAKNIGINLNRKSGALYNTNSGGLVGIAYASERMNNRWFLGLPVEDYHAIVLLCEKKGGEILRFVLPKDIFRSYKDKFSTAGGQIKFNVILRYDEFRMTIPRTGRIILNKYLDEFKNLQIH